MVHKMDVVGVDIFRINLSHTKIEDLTSLVCNIRQWTKKTICLDTEGAQIRTGTMQNGSVLIKNNSIVCLTSSDSPGDASQIPLYPAKPQEMLELGDIISIDFQSVVVQVVRFEKGQAYGRVLSGGEIGSNKGISVDRVITLPALTKKDLEACAIARELGLSHFALSFASGKEDVQRLRDLFPYPIFVISKIESRLGVKHLEDICLVSDAILIDRGDLSREVSATKIALVQKHILDSAQKIGTPVYIATNLLESMIHNFQPTRGEINDITSTLLAGAQGLVLAAETAIGKYPVQSTRMVSEIKREVVNYLTVGKKEYFNSIYDHDLIEPHGGVLVQNVLDADTAREGERMPFIEVGDQILSDIVQIAEGTYSPLSGFMNYEELLSVLEQYKLPSGTVWTLPILLQLPKRDIHFLKHSRIAIRRTNDKKVYAVMNVSNIENIDLAAVAQKWFGTQDLHHPGVALFYKKGSYIVSGEVFLVCRPPDDFNAYHLTPRQTRQIFKDRGWRKIVGFHTRNVIHLGHEFVQKAALERVAADALFISPVVGHKKPTDFSAGAILKTYDIMLQNNYYAPYPALLGTFNTYSRYSGPREAVFTALCRKNLGCSHFVIGRDHTGVGNYYAPDASQRIFDNIGDIGIVPLMFEAAYFCDGCCRVTTQCSHQRERQHTISGTKVRKYLVDREEIPEYLMRKDIIRELQAMYRNSRDTVFEKESL